MDKQWGPAVCSTGNSIQSLGLEHDGWWGIIGEKDTHTNTHTHTHTHTTRSFCCTAEIGTIL